MLLRKSEGSRDVVSCQVEVLFEKELLDHMLGYSVLLVVKMAGHDCQHVL
jgi:hypothetical protein